MARFPLGEWAIRRFRLSEIYPGEGFELRRAVLIW